MDRGGRGGSQRGVSFELTEPTTSSAAAGQSSNRSGSLLRQVSIKAQSALGVRAETNANASDMWKQRRLRLLASYGNLRVQKLPPPTPMTLQEPRSRRSIDRQLSLPTSATSASASAARLRANVTDLGAATAPLLAGSRKVPAVETRDRYDGVRAPADLLTPRSGAELEPGELQRQESLSRVRQLNRRDNAINSLFRALSHMASTPRSPAGSYAATPAATLLSTAALPPTSSLGSSRPAAVRLPPLVERPGGDSPEDGDRLGRGLDVLDQSAARQPRNVFADNFRTAVESMRHSQEINEAALQSQGVQPEAPIQHGGQGRNLLSRLRLSCLTKNESTAELLTDINDFLMFRPYFTYWITAVHLVIFLATLIHFGFAPVGITLLSTRSATVVNRNMLSVKVCAIDYYNLFLGPRMSDLIKVGAKYSVCMRRYDKLYREILDPQRRAESETGCCVHNDGSACYQSQRTGCPAQMAVWLKWANWSSGPDGRTSGPVCGQDPRTCEEPKSLTGSLAWPNSIVDWPVCKKQTAVGANATDLASPSESTMAHLACQISARPCCVGIKGECVVTSQQRCEFMRGVFFPDKQLCSQVNCLGESCGMFGVSNPQRPNQFYRVFTSLFLHSGVITLAVTLVHHLLFLRMLEQSFGWHRTALIYLGSGVIGNLFSMIFLPYVVDVGPISAQIGSLAPIVIEICMSWRFVADKARMIGLFVGAPLVLIVFGFFPWFDNFANLGGLISGCLLSVVLLPYINYGRDDPTALLCRRISVAICLTVWLLLLGGLFAVFYLSPLNSCDFCVYFSCGPKWFDKFFTEQNYVDYCGDADLSNLEPTRCIGKLTDQVS